MTKTARPLLLLFLAAGCGSHAGPPGEVRYVPDCDVEIAQAAQIGDPVLRLYDVRDLTTGPESFPGEDINLNPSGGFFFDDVRGRAESVFTRPAPRTPRRSGLAPNRTRLRIGDDESLPLEVMSATVRIDGFRARVFIETVYRNPHDRQLEGTYQLRLPDGASPFYLAFGARATRDDAPVSLAPLLLEAGTVSAGRTAGSRSAGGGWEIPREARMAPRERAAHAYGETVRRRVDPALMEWSGAGIFSTRVFPLEPGRLHRIVLGYDVDLRPVADGLEFRLDLPEGVAERAALLDVSSEPIEVSPRPDSLARDGRVIFRFARPAADAIRVRMPDHRAALLIGEDEAAGTFFAARVRPEVPGGTVPSRARAVFLLDLSLSTDPESASLRLDLLQAILERNRAEIREFAVLFFNVDAFWWRDGYAPNTPGSVAGLQSHAEDLLVEGATDLGHALETALSAPWIGAGGAAPDLFLLSDGAATWGETDPGALAERLPGAGRLFAYATGEAGGDRSTLGRLAADSGGAVFAVAGTADLAGAAVAHRSAPWRIDRIEAAGAADLLVRGRPTHVYPGQTLAVLGRGAPEGLRLVLRRGVEVREWQTDLASPIESALAPRAYGEAAVAGLEDAGADAEEPARAFATHFRVVGRTCSLVMLETDEDYERFGIDPGANAKLVRETRAAPLLSEIAARRGAQRSDARDAFRHRLARLEKVMGAGFTITPSLTAAVDGLSISVFLAPPTGLCCRARRLRDSPATYRSALAFRPLDDEALLEEAERRRTAWGADDALRVLSSRLEESPGDVRVLRDLAFFALSWKSPEHAIHLLLRAADLRPFEGETYRLLAIASEAAGSYDAAIVWYEVALAGEWSGRAPDSRKIAAAGYAALLRRIGRREISCSIPTLAERALARIGDLAGAEPDLAVTVSWNTDRTDVDLHVTDPEGEECYYEHPETKLGGRLSGDVTTGFGPERFAVERASPGEYRVQVNYFASNGNLTSLRTRVLAEIRRRGRGKPDLRVVTLATAKDLVEVETILERER